MIEPFASNVLMSYTEQTRKNLLYLHCWSVDRFDISSGLDCGVLQAAKQSGEKSNQDKVKKNMQQKLKEKKKQQRVGVVGMIRGALLRTIPSDPVCDLV